MHSKQQNRENNNTAVFHLSSKDKYRCISANWVNEKHKHWWA